MVRARFGNCVIMILPFVERSALLHKAHLFSSNFKLQLYCIIICPRVTLVEQCEVFQAEYADWSVILRVTFDEEPDQLIFTLCVIQISLHLIQQRFLRLRRAINKTIADQNHQNFFGFALLRQNVDFFKSPNMSSMVIVLTNSFHGSFSLIFFKCVM